MIILAAAKNRSACDNHRSHMQLEKLPDVGLSKTRIEYPNAGHHIVQSGCSNKWSQSLEWRIKAVIEAREHKLHRMPYTQCKQATDMHEM